MADITTIQIRAETWRELNRQKEPGDTFDDVIQRLLHGVDDESEERVDGHTHGRETQHEQQQQEEEEDRVEQIIATVSESWEDAPERLEARRDAARAALRLALERGTLSKAEAVRDVLPDHEVDGQSETTWWRKNVRPVLQHVGDHAPGRGYVVNDGTE